MSAVSKFRFVAVQPTRIGDRKKLKAASYLLDFLTDHQTDASGLVNYGRPFGYAWIRAHWHGNPDDRPPIRTLERHMRLLKTAGYIETRTLGFGGGMIVRLRSSAKWQNQTDEPAEQMPLFTVLPVQIRNVKPVEKRQISTVSNFHIPPNMAVVDRQKWRRKEVKENTEEKYRHTNEVVRVEKSKAEIDERRRELLDQAEMLAKKFKTAG